MTRGSVFISPYNEKWVHDYQVEARKIKNALNDILVKIEHVGSTAVPGLAAKPIIDIMVAINSLENTPQIVEKMARLGYDYNDRYEDIMPFRRYFVKKGEFEHLVHVHMVEKDHPFWTKHIAVRDYLRKFDEAKRDYAQLKVELAGEFGENREKYQEGKADFLQNLEEKALKFFGHEI